MSIVIIGGAGFIGSRLVKNFLDNDEDVLVLDNLCRGKKEYLSKDLKPEKLKFEDMDVSNLSDVYNILKIFNDRNPVSVVWHLAANSDIPAGISDINVDYKNTFMTTFAILETMKRLNLKELVFSSSSAVYGDHGENVVLTENSGPLLPISNYGAMKLASEAIISAATECYLDHSWIFRFPNVIGTPATHGIIYDLIGKLKNNPEKLPVLGNGTQQKAYLHVDELIEGMLFVFKNAKDKMNLYNIGPDDRGCRISDIAEAVVRIVSPDAEIVYGNESRGWIGDVPKFYYNIDKIKKLGWHPKLSSKEAVERAVTEIYKQEW